MSEHAAAYYHERAERLGIAEVPQVLEGEVIPLSPHVPPLAIHHPNANHVALVSVRLQRALESTHGFVLAGTPPGEEYPRQYTEVMTTKNDAFIAGFTGKILVPKALKTGRIDNLQLKAIAGTEVPEPLLARVKKSRQGGPVIESAGDDSTEVYFKAGGNIKTGGRNLQVGGLVVVRAVHLTRGDYEGGELKSTAVQYTGTPLKTNEILGWKVRGETAAVSDIVTEHNVRRPHRG